MCVCLVTVVVARRRVRQLCDLAGTPDSMIVEIAAVLIDDPDRAWGYAKGGLHEQQRMVELLNMALATNEDLDVGTSSSEIDSEAEPSDSDSSDGSVYDEDMVHSVVLAHDDDPQDPSTSSV